MAVIANQRCVTFVVSFTGNIYHPPEVTCLGRKDKPRKLIHDRVFSQSLEIFQRVLFQRLPCTLIYTKSGEGSMLRNASAFAFGKQNVAK